VSFNTRSSDVEPLKNSEVTTLLKKKTSISSERTSKRGTPLSEMELMFQSRNRCYSTRNKQPLTKHLECTEAFVWGKGGTYCYPGGDQITFVKDEDEMFVWCLLFEILLNGTTSRAHWIAGVENIDNHVR